MAQGGRFPWIHSLENSDGCPVEDWAVSGWRINTEDVLIGSQFQLSLVEERLLPMVKLVYRIRPEEDKNTQLELS